MWMRSQKKIVLKLTTYLWQWNETIEIAQLWGCFEHKNNKQESSMAKIKTHRRESYVFVYVRVFSSFDSFRKESAWLCILQYINHVCLLAADIFSLFYVMLLAMMFLQLFTNPILYGWQYFCYFPLTTSHLCVANEICKAILFRKHTSSCIYFQLVGFFFLLLVMCVHLQFAWVWIFQCILSIAHALQNWPCSPSHRLL